jgi:hypothetical protein
MVRYFISESPFPLLPASLLRSTHTPTVRWLYRPKTSSDLRLREMGDD